MKTVHQPPVSGEQDGPRVTPYFTAVLEREAARRGLPAADRCPVCGRKLRWCNCGY